MALQNNVEYLTFMLDFQDGIWMPQYSYSAGCNRNGA